MQRLSLVICCRLQRIHENSETLNNIITRPKTIHTKRLDHRYTINNNSNKSRPRRRAAPPPASAPPQSPRWSRSTPLGCYPRGCRAAWRPERASPAHASAEVALWLLTSALLITSSSITNNDKNDNNNRKIINHNNHHHHSRIHGHHYCALGVTHPKQQKQTQRSHSRRVPPRTPGCFSDCISIYICLNLKCFVSLWLGLLTGTTTLLYPTA